MDTVSPLFSTIHTYITPYICVMQRVGKLIVSFLHFKYIFLNSLIAIVACIDQCVNMHSILD